MRSIRALAPRVAKGVRAVFTDIDDTLTTEGRLRSSAFEAMWSLV